MATKPKSGKKKPIADVAQPGTTAPSDTSKPIIKHGPMMRDPMVVESAEKKAEADVPMVTKTAELKVEPPASETEPAEEPSADNDPEEPAEDGKSGQDKTGTPDTPAKEDSAKNQKKVDPDAEAEAEAAAEAKLEQVIDSKKYFLPINTVEHRKSRRFVILGVILAVVLAVAWADIALDAGIIDLGGVKPVTHFFSN